MADEITLSIDLQCENGDFEFRRSINGVELDQAAQGYAGGIQSLTTTEEAIIVNEISTAGYAWFRNIGDNPVQIGHTVSAAFYGFLQLAVDQVAVCPLAALTYQAKATTGTSKLEYHILED
jgi:hypothetical protein